MFNKRYISMKEHDEAISNLRDKIEVQSSLADAEINSLKGRLKESDNKYNTVISSLGKVIDDNFVVIQKEEYNTKCKSLGGLITSNKTYKEKIGVLTRDLNNISNDKLKLQKVLNDYKNTNLALESANKNILEENAKMKKIIEDLSNPKNPPTMEKLIEYRDMSKNGKGKLTRRNKKIH